MINDLLRENISVYWSQDDFSALSKSLDLVSPTSSVFYKKGAFIIPFYGDEYKDALITSIINDYNQTHELENQSPIKNMVYILQEELNIKSSKLVEPKIVQHLGTPTRYSWPTYLLMADAGGFLTIEYLLDNETSSFLNNEDFNIFIWPYLPSSATYYEQFRSFTNTQQVNAIRSFVNNGGGYIGTCYGAYAASSGIMALNPLLSLRLAYNSDLPRILPGLSLSISDSIMKINVDALANLHISIHQVEQPNHPVFYGVNDTFTDFLKSPLFAWLGKNTRVLCTFKDLKKSDGVTDASNTLKKAVIGTPSWVNSTFGKGKIILYSSHPDYINNMTPLFKDREWDGDRYYGRRIIHNSMFFVSSEENVEMQADKSYSLSFIASVIEDTENLSMINSKNHEFNEIFQRLTNLSNNIANLKNSIIKLQELFLPLENESIIFSKGYKISKYARSYCEIYQDYINRSQENINKLEQIIPMISEFDETIEEKVIVLKNDLNQRINNSEKILTKVTNIAEKLEETITASRINTFKKLQLLNGRRSLLDTFEIGLKYIPQTYFETLKLLRHSWYNYEANIANEV